MILHKRQGEEEVKDKLYFQLDFCLPYFVSFFLASTRLPGIQSDPWDMIDILLKAGKSWNNNSDKIERLELEITGLLIDIKTVKDDKHKLSEEQN